MSKHWSRISEIWKQVGSPLRPSEEDLEFIKPKINQLENKGVLKVLVLGVTPEYYYLPWPPNTVLRAADHTKEMIKELWPGPEGSAECCEWTNLSIESSSVDMILCDGGLHLLRYPDGQKKLIKEIKRVLRPGGIFLLRLFLPPEKEQSLESVISNLLEGKIANLNELKLHLWAALQENKRKGVNLHEVWSAVHKIAPDLHTFSSKMNWPVEHLQVLNTYKQSDKQYYMIDKNDVITMFTDAPGGFKINSIQSPAYRLGDRCPTVTFERLQS